MKCSKKDDKKNYFIRKKGFNVQHRIFTECIFRKKML
jgi:hypothetical protein